MAIRRVEIALAKLSSRACGTTSHPVVEVITLWLMQIDSQNPLHPRHPASGHHPSKLLPIRLHPASDHYPSNLLPIRLQGGYRALGFEAQIFRQ